MVVDRSADLVHEKILSLPHLLRRGDLLVFNDVRVRSARLKAERKGGGAAELLLLRPLGSGHWECLAKPAKRLRPGVRLVLPAAVEAEVIERLIDGRVVVSLDNVVDVPAYLDRYGELPLPPYIRRPNGPDAKDAERYQTVFARTSAAVAAPTAGLHFSQRLLRSLDEAGITRAHVTLEVGPATFMPLRSDVLDDVQLEAERALISAQTVQAIDETKDAGGRVIAVGTTTTRALESCAATAEGLSAGEYWANAFIRPGFKFRVIDGLLTNFHLPRSTLLVLVSALAGRQRILAAYEEAVRWEYRFYSYGDAMLII